MDVEYQHRLSSFARQMQEIDSKKKATMRRALLSTRNALVAEGIREARDLREVPGPLPRASAPAFSFH